MAAIKRSGVRVDGAMVGGVLCDEEDQMLGVQHFIQNGHADLSDPSNSGSGSGNNSR